MKVPLYRVALLTFFVFGMIFLELPDVRFGGMRLNTPIFSLIALYCIVLSIPNLIANSKAMLKPQNYFFIAYCVWISISASWAPDPQDSILQSAAIMLCAVGALAFADFPVSLTLKVLLAFCVGVALLSWVVAFGLPSVGLQSTSFWRLRGIMAHTQRLALLMIVGLLCISAARARGDVFRSKSTLLFLGVTGLLLLTLLATKTRAFTTFAIIICGFTFYLTLQRWLKVAYAALVVAVGGLLVAAPTLLEGAYERQGSNSETLSGRTTIWAGAWEMIKQQPIQGYGFASFREAGTNRFFANYVAPHAHNTWINATFETGFIGSILLTLFMLSLVYVEFRRYGRERVPSYSLVLMLFCVICGLTGVLLGTKITTPFAILLLVSMQTPAIVTPKPVYRNARRNLRPKFRMPEPSRPFLDGPEK